MFEAVHTPSEKQYQELVPQGAKTVLLDPLMLISQQTQTLYYWPPGCYFHNTRGGSRIFCKGGPEFCARVSARTKFGFLI